MAGALAQCSQPTIKNKLIRAFVKHFNVDLSEAAKIAPEDYENFNDFFTRPLASGARTIEGSDMDWVSPVDGCVSQAGSITQGQLIQAKGRHFTLNQLLGSNTEQAARYNNGEFATLYLSPKDYHRIHAPLNSTLISTTFIPGKLFSVNGTTANHVKHLFARNERLVCEFDSEQGRFILVFVGAMIVASIETVWSGVVAPFERKIVRNQHNNSPLTFKKGDELGRFKLGSTVIMLTESGISPWTKQLHCEKTLKMGQQLN